MGIFSAVIDAFVEDQVQMPQQIAPARLVEHAGAVRAQVAEIRRIEEARRLAEERKRREDEARREAVGHDDDSSCSVRYKSISPADMQLSLDFSQKRPPDLCAPVLSFSARLLKFVNERYDGRGPYAYKRAGVDRKLYSRITSNDRSSVAKLTALQFAIGLQLNRQETDEFLAAAGYALSKTIPVDCVFAYCIDHGIRNIFDVNRILVDVGLPAMNLSV